MYLRGSGPQFYDAGGNPISQMNCGSIYSFDVPGYSKIWLDQVHNGAQSFSGPFAVPMPSYIADCVSQVGQYINNAYTIDANGNRGSFIGSTTITILPGTLPQGVVPSDVAQASVTGIASMFSSIPLWAWAALGLGAVLFAGGGKRKPA